MKVVTKSETCHWFRLIGKCTGTISTARIHTGFIPTSSYLVRITNVELMIHSERVLLLVYRESDLL